MKPDDPQKYDPFFIGNRRLFTQTDHADYHNQAENGHKAAGINMIKKDGNGPKNTVVGQEIRPPRASPSLDCRADGVFLKVRGLI